MQSRDPGGRCFLDLSDRTKLRLTGTDQLRFVNGQITNDIRKATASSAIAACVLNVKGKLNAHLFASVRDDSIFIDADPALNEALTGRLERYIIADDVQIEDVSAQFSLFHVIGEPPNIADGTVLSANRFGQPGFDLWVDSTRHDAVAESLSAEVPFCDRDCAEVLRIEQGVPSWGRELTEEIIPVEANLEESSIDYAKGCYIGQEVISRMKMSGQRNKSLCGLVVPNDTALISGTKLFSAADNEREIGWITSAVWSDRLGKYIGLGYLKRPFNQPGAEVIAKLAENKLLPARVVSLPFAPG